MTIYKKSQVSFFLMFSVIIILFIYGSLFFVSTARTNALAQKKVSQMVSETKQSPFSFYVSTCMDYATKETIMDVGRNAFFPGSEVRIHNHEYAIPMAYNGSDYFPYLIYSTNFSNGVFFLPPLWPSNAYYSFNYSSFPPVSLPPIGIPKFMYGQQNPILLELYKNKLPSLSDKSAFYQALVRFVPELWPLEPNASGFSGDPNAVFYHVNRSYYLSSYMAKDIKEKVLACLNLPWFSRVNGINYTIKSLNISVSLSDVAVFSQLKMDYVSKNLYGYSKPKESGILIKKEYVFPLKKIYDTLYTMIKKELFDLSFKFTQQISTLNSILGVQVTSKVFNSQNYPAGRLFTVKTTKPFYKGKPWVLRFAIADRFPVLFKVGGVHYLGNKIFNYVVTSGQYLTIKPLAVDPDEDPIGFTYLGWKTNSGGHGSSFRVPYDFVHSPSNLWQSSLLYNSQCQAPSQFSSFDPSASRCARIQTDAYDAISHAAGKEPGEHEFTVLVNDLDHAGFDYQNVLVKVFQQPITLSGTNDYSDVNNSWVSYEDLYKLTISGSTLTSFAIVNLSAGNLEKTYTVVPGTQLILPNDILYQNINSNNKYKPGFFSTHVGSTGAIALNVTVGQHSNTLHLDLKQCLPHRSSVPSYPFSLLDHSHLNPYQANHTCCNAQGEYSSGTCYQSAETVCGFWAKNGSYLKSKGINTSIFSSFTTTANTLNGNDYYDIYKVAIDSKCSGNRGNLCNGATTETWTKIEGTGYNASLREQCTGCLNGQKQLFTGTTFEKTVYNETGINLLASGTPTGICSRSPVATDILSGTGGKKSF